ncbi:DNA replication ATP-dependent helicase/nuclease DNA2 isoform X2 [Prorops nasuta]|uniref:DNA replication ATP-dependent helicase/nuclease DNA2 isoform X2 n=1 Tax=Prorops nasuta TaxID=863751 RepID=UPI0034CF8EE0
MDISYKKTISNTTRGQSQKTNSSFLLESVKTDKNVDNSKSVIELIKKRKSKEDVENPQQVLKMAKFENTVSLSDKDSVSQESLGIGSIDETSTTEFSSNETDFFFDDDWDTPEGPELDLSFLQRCKVSAVESDNNSLVLTVRESIGSSVSTVILKWPWASLNIEKNDTIVVKANKKLGKWLVDHHNGYVIIQPDILIASTTITCSFFCNRKAVLGEIFKRINNLPSENVASGSRIMIIGSIVHEVLQKSIKQKVNKINNISLIMKKVLKSPDVIKTLYANNIDIDSFKEEIAAFIPKIHQFIQHYMEGQKSLEISKSSNNYQGKIQKVHDIEESVWLPRMGLKGNIDLSVEIANSGLKGKIVPLEVKTGYPSFSIEHRAQVILYSMMMSEMKDEIDSGLLLYLKNNAMQEIRHTRNEKRDLVTTRNNLAHFISKLQKPQIDENNVWKSLDLPDPINHRNACNSCSYKTICCSLLTKENKNLPPEHPIVELSQEILEDIKPHHIDYVIKWIALLQLENIAENQDNAMKDLWTKCAEEREKRGNCLSYLKVVETVAIEDDHFKTIFARKGIVRSALSFEKFENLYVAVSTEDRVHISAGHVVSVTDKLITVMLNRDITKRYDNTYHIDKYPFGVNVSNFANIAGLLFNEPKFSRIRQIVIDNSAKFLTQLNENQRKAVLKALSANEYLLIKGMPGTGKTETIIALIEVLKSMGQSILITAHTHSAVDNVLLKLLNNNIDFLRLGSSSACSQEMTGKYEESLIASCDTPEKLNEAYMSKNIVGMTCQGCGTHVLLQKRTFDVCIVDESTQVLQPTVLRPLYSAKKFILVGDPKQLPPIARSDIARNYCVNESLFARLDQPDNTVSLTLQYRMNKIIMDLANKLTYNNKLVCGNSNVEKATFIDDYVKPGNFEISEYCEKWAAKIVSAKLEDSVILVNTGSTFDLKAEYDEKNQFSLHERVNSNVLEAALVMYLVNTFIQMGVEANSIGIITPYVCQAELLKKFIREKIEVSTVDKYQGRDKDIILYSCGKTGDNKKEVVREYEILEDHQRLTVAITRAKMKLIIISDVNILSVYKPFKKLFNSIKDDNIVNLISGEDDFSWNALSARCNI